MQGFVTSDDNCTDLAEAADAVKGPQLPDLGHDECLALQDVVVREHQLLAILQHTVASSSEEHDYEW